MYRQEGSPEVATKLNRLVPIRHIHQQMRTIALQTVYKL